MARVKFSPSHYLKNTRSVKIPNLDAEIKDRYASGWSQREISDVFGISNHRVRQITKDVNPTFHKVAVKERNARLRKRLDEYFEEHPRAKNRKAARKRLRGMREVGLAAYYREDNPNAAVIEYLKKVGSP